MSCGFQIDKAYTKIVRTWREPFEKKKFWLGISKSPLGGRKETFKIVQLRHGMKSNSEGKSDSFCVVSLEKSFTLWYRRRMETLALGKWMSAFIKGLKSKIGNMRTEFHISLFTWNSISVLSHQVTELQFHYTVFPPS